MVGREEISQNPEQTFQADFKKLVFKSIAWKLIKTAIDFAQSRIRISTADRLEIWACTTSEIRPQKCGPIIDQTLLLL